MSNLSNFMEAMKLENKSVETIRTYDKALRKYESFVKAKNLKHGKETLIAFLTQMTQREKKKPATVRLYMTVIKRYYDFNEWKYPKIKTPTIHVGPPKFIERDALKRLYDETEGDPQLRAEFSLAYCSAMRISELTSRKFSDLDLNKKTIFVHGKTKESSDAFLPLNDTCIKDLVVYMTWRSQEGMPELKANDFLFHRYGNPQAAVPVSTLTEQLYSLCRKVGIAEQSWHKIRHSRATHMRDDGVPIEAIQEQLRHGSINTTLRYARSDSERLRKKTAGSDVLKTD